MGFGFKRRKKHRRVSLVVIGLSITIDTFMLDILFTKTNRTYIIVPYSKKYNK